MKKKAGPFKPIQCTIFVAVASPSTVGTTVLYVCTFTSQKCERDPPD